MCSTDRIGLFSSTPAWLLSLVLCVFMMTAFSQAEVEHKVYCSAKEMRVSIQLPDSKTQVYIDKLKGYPDCKPILEGNRAMFHLSLEDIYTCGTTRISDFQGHRIFYNKIIVEVSKNKKEKIRFKCGTRGKNLLGIGAPRPRVERDVLPEGFYEPDDINITETIIANGALPELNVGVRQNGLFIDTQVNVQPGTPLEMELFLDQNSTDTYGLFVNYMNVTDRNPTQKEIIIYKGCSVDPYLFSNFELQSDNRVAAKFRAFKFPESSFVLFIGTVKICVGPCQGIPCSNGELGYGRKRRDLTSFDQRDPNQIFEITMTTILKVDQSEQAPVSKGSTFIGGAAKGSGNNAIIVPASEQNYDAEDSKDTNKVFENNGMTSLSPSLLSLFMFLIIVAAL